MHLTIFDLDRTLARVNVSFAFGKYLYKMKHLKALEMLLLVGIYALHKCGLFKVEVVHSLAFRSIFRHKPAALIQNQIRAFLHESGDLLFRPHVVARLKQAQALNHLVWIQSSSPECIVMPIAEQFGVHQVLASRYQIDAEGTFSRIEQVINGAMKRKFLEEFIEKNLVSRKDVTAYSDSLLDLPLLEGVGTAIVVCPERKLKRLAKRRNWKVWEEK